MLFPQPAAMTKSGSGSGGQQRVESSECSIYQDITAGCDVSGADSHRCVSHDVPVLFFWHAPASPLRHLLYARGAHLSHTSSFSLRIPGARQLYPASHPARPGGARLPQTSAAYQRACPGVPSLRRDRAKPAGQCHTLPRGPWSCTSSTTPWTGSTLM